MTAYCLRYVRTDYAKRIRKAYESGQLDEYEAEFVTRAVKEQVERDEDLW